MKSMATSLTPNPGKQLWPFGTLSCPVAFTFSEGIVMSNQEELSSDLKHALELAIMSKCRPDKVVKEVSKHIPEGTKVAFDLRVEIKGILTRAKGFEVCPTTSLLSKVVIARLLRSLGVTREAAKKALIEAMMASLQTPGQGSVADQLIEEDRQLLLTLDEVDKDILARLPKVRRNGSIKVVSAVTLMKSKLEPMNLPAA